MKRASCLRQKVVGREKSRGKGRIAFALSLLLFLLPFGTRAGEKREIGRERRLLFEEEYPETDEKVSSISEEDREVIRNLDLLMDWELLSEGADLWGLLEDFEIIEGLEREEKGVEK